MKEGALFNIKGISQELRKRFKARATIEGKTEQSLVRDLYREKALGTIGVIKEHVDEFSVVSTDQELILIIEHIHKILEKRKKASE